jgi:hypothetical protein
LPTLRLLFATPQRSIPPNERPQRRSEAVCLLFGNYNRFNDIQRWVALLPVELPGCFGEQTEKAAR